MKEWYCSYADLSSTAAADLRETSEANRAMSPGSTTNGRMESKKAENKNHDQTERFDWKCPTK